MICRQPWKPSSFLFLVFFFIVCIDAKDDEFVKLVGLVPVRDEAHLLPSCLRALAKIVHAIVVLDDCSVDGSAEVAYSLEEECRIERVERSRTCRTDGGSGVVLPFWGSEADHRAYLLELGRSVGGTHFLAIDADEVVVVGEGKMGEMKEFRDMFLNLKPGDLLVLHYITMFSSSKEYRSDKSDFKAVGGYLSSSVPERFLHVCYCHVVLSSPQSTSCKVWELRFDQKTHPPSVAVLHFGFSNLANARMKNVIYNFFDIVCYLIYPEDEKRHERWAGKSGFNISIGIFDHSDSSGSYAPPMGKMPAR
ncbi:hypothetical protein GUITHDRAFT_121395 [Guillardia theta CCMP2712]|uniref:Glycosyltransferase 2-like domain-containing protein n=1 Tax=Guillardia theta (strain CCMP2712) TaxID=905079 RepID=L1I996_GUITC|nr:hypothetical protein GUITHDRAFT_121395 [Guillardia theta CCMP2712]EKX32430.1 hypothetical protein GUITHDRAFT_121395 [Guillardia theta CCMP2712]|eukprot:XP_005819410.1 hypothetical protein GUITHDRAFT_121395 [Guillardia theta CCMP2712]